MDLAEFIAVASLVVVTPGPDMSLVARNMFAGGRPSGLATSVGTCSGLLVHATAAALGLSAVLLASSQAFTVVKIAGAAYLIFLGVRTILGAPPGDILPGWSEGRPLGRLSTGDPHQRPRSQGGDLLPLVAAAFVEPGPGFTWRLLPLSGLFIVMGSVWLTIYTVAVHAVSGFVGRPRVKTIIESVTGSVLMALGVRLTFQRR